MIDKNISYNDLDIKYLSIYLNLNKKLVLRFKLILCLIFFVLLEVIIVLFDIGNHYYLYLIPIILTIILYFLLSITKKYKKREDKYLAKVKSKYNQIKEKYIDYKCYLVGVKPNGLNKLTKNTCLLFTNNYRIIIIEDVFNVSGYSFKDNKELKVLDDINLENNICYNFLITEIKSFKLNGTIEDNKEIETDSYDSVKYSTIKIELKDLTTIEISSNIYGLLKEVNGMAEIK